MSSNSDKVTIIDQVRQLHDLQLFDDVKSLASMVLSLIENNPEFLSTQQKYHLMVYQAEAFFHSKDYKKSEYLYDQALQVKKSLNKSKVKKEPLNRLVFKSDGKVPVIDILSEVEVRYKLHLCMCYNKQPYEAILVLEDMTLKQRTPKINLALAKLHQLTGSDRSAITHYKEVLRECPLSLEAAKGLMSLGVSGPELTNLMMNGLNSLSNFEWLNSWIKAQTHSHNHEYSTAIPIYKSLDCKPYLRDNVDLLCNLGEAYFLNGDYIMAMTTLHRAQLLDQYLLRCMDILAFLYAHEKKVVELNRLTTSLMSITDQAPEPWVAVGYYCLATKKVTRAVYFAQKAYQLDNQCIEAFLLKGTALLQLKKYQEAILHYGEALRKAPNRYELHKGWLQCYMATHRMREAVSYAGQAYKQLGANARSLTLYASVLAKEPLSVEKAKGYLEKALKLEPSHLEAVYLLAEIFSKQQQFDKAIELVRKQLKEQSTIHLHLLMGDLLSQVNEHQEALDQYSIALSMDSNNQKAREGIERVEKHATDLGLDSTYDVDVEDIITDNEAELDGSDIESAWSDTDPY